MCTSLKGSQRLGCSAGAVKPHSPGQSEAPPWVADVFETSPERAAQTVAAENVAPFQGLVCLYAPVTQGGASLCPGLGRPPPALRRGPTALSLSGSGKGTQKAYLRAIGDRSQNRTRAAQPTTPTQSLFWYLSPKSEILNLEILVSGICPQWPVDKLVDKLRDVVFVRA